MPHCHRKRGVSLGETWHDLANRHERLRVRIIEGPQQDTVDDREDGNRGAESQRQRPDDGRGIQPVTPQATPRIAKVIEKRAHARLDGKTCEGVGRDRRR
jgi:hypothetical protein